MCGLLSEKCVVLVTHQTQYLQQCHAVLKLIEVLAVTTWFCVFTILQGKVVPNDITDFEGTHSQGS